MTWPQFFCGFFGRHDFHLKCDTSRTWQQCYHCKLDRPGWTLDARATTRLQKVKRTAAQDRKILEMKRRWRA